MSVIKFELTDNHINLLRNMVWSETELEPIVGEFLGDYVIEEMGIIVFGMPDAAFDPTNDKVIPYSEEQIEVLNKLKSELPMAMDIVMQNGSFETGMYKRKFHLRDWKKDEQKKLS